VCSQICFHKRCLNGRSYIGARVAVVERRQHALREGIREAIRGVMLLSRLVTIGVVAERCDRAKTVSLDVPRDVEQAVAAAYDDLIRDAIRQPDPRSKVGDWRVLLIPAVLADSPSGQPPRRFGRPALGQWGWRRWGRTRRCGHFSRSPALQIPANAQVQSQLL